MILVGKVRMNPRFIAIIEPTGVGMLHIFMVGNTRPIVIAPEDVAEFERKYADYLIATERLPQ